MKDRFFLRQLNESFFLLNREDKSMNWTISRFFFLLKREDHTPDSYSVFPLYFPLIYESNHLRYGSFLDFLLLFSSERESVPVLKELLRKYVNAFSHHFFKRIPPFFHSDTRGIQKTWISIKLSSYILESTVTIQEEMETLLVAVEVLVVEAVVLQHLDFEKPRQGKRKRIDSFLQQLVDPCQ
jgi:hypothetical protein